MVGVDVNRRMAKALLELAEKYGLKEEGGGVRIDRPITDEDLAGMVGLRSVEVAHLLRNYQYEDIIRVERGFISLPRPEVLEGWLTRL
jgi:CRP-like cAMP-binding protein